MEMDCASRRGSHEVCYELSMCSGVQSTVFGRFALLPIQYSSCIAHSFDHNWDTLLNGSFCPQYFWLWTNIHLRLLKILPWYFSKWNFRSSKIQNLVITYSPILTYFFLFHLFLLVFITVTSINHFSPLSIDLHVSWINPGRFGVALTFRCSRLSATLMPWSTWISDSSSNS